MTSSIRQAVNQLAQEDAFFRLPKGSNDRLMAHIRQTLKRYEWQFHSGVDLAELLDPFLLAVDREAARKHYGPKVSAPAPDVFAFPLREHDPEDYPPGQEPWIAGLLRQWALEYERENGEVKEGWGEWTKITDNESQWSWEWPYKRILAHKTEPNGQVRYLVKWVGERFTESWLEKDNLDPNARVASDIEHGIVHQKYKQTKPKKRKS